MKKKLTITDIKNIIPHRYENLLIDNCQIETAFCCKFNLSLTENDSLNRNIFLKKLLSKTIIPTPLLSETAALASITCSGKIDKNSFAYFAAITNFNCTHTIFKSSETLHGTAKKVSQKKEFFKYFFEIKNGENIASGHLLAYYSKTDTASVEIPILSLDEMITKKLNSNKTPIHPNKNKQNHMTFIDYHHELNSMSDALYSYQYPLNHPFIKGHFPGNPVMMGVCQWIMLEDGLNHFLNQHATNYVEKKNLIISCNAILFKKDLTPICDIKSATLYGSFNENDWDVSTKSVKKILFKQRVLPGTYLFIHISDIIIK